jgi:putative membrane protein
MILGAFLAAVHYLALALGLGGVFARGQRLRDLRRTPTDATALTRLLRADSVWGIAAVLWLGTGLVRAFGHIEKQPVFYLRNGFFHLKMTLFLLVLLLELAPMITFIRWRIALRKKQDPVATTRLGRLIRINDIEVALVVCIPFTAALMARGVWLF